MGAPPVPLGPVVTVMSDGTSRGQVDDQASKKEQSTMDVARFEDLQAAFLERIQHAVYCNVATIDHHQRPRSRVMHPIWDGAIGWVISWPQSHKAKHLAQNPAVSLAYLHNPLKPVYVDGTATWIDDATEQRRIWELHKTTPPPLGFDPEPHYGSIEHPYFGLLRVLPWRIELGDLYGESRIWRRPSTTPSEA